MNSADNLFDKHRRANAILLLDDGESCARIAKVFYLDDDTIRGWYKSYRQDGWDALAFDGWKGGQSRMKQAQEVALCAWLKARFCRSTVEIRAHVAAECGLNYSHYGCIKLLARLDFEYRKPKALPRVADVAKQAEFIAMYENMLNSLAMMRRYTSHLLGVFKQTPVRQWTPCIQNIKANLPLVG